MAQILAVGIATLDIINTVADFPSEDTEVRTVSQRQSRGGNATNTLAVLNQFKHQCTWAGVLIDNASSQKILDDLKQNKINLTPCQRLPTGSMPTSYITLNQHTGSRTIVHHRDCPEYSFEHFKQIDLTRFDWIHFEGRNIDQTYEMLQYLQHTHPSIPCSLEVEKPRPDIERLFPFVSLLLFSQHYAQHQGFSSASDLLQSLPTGTTASCTWGEHGAWAISSSSLLYHAEAYCPGHVIDTLGAGDTFNAGLIHTLLKGNNLDYALSEACRLAGIKCSQHGFLQLATQFNLT